MVGLGVASLNVEELQLVKFFTVEEKLKIKESGLNKDNEKLESLKTEIVDYSLSNSSLP